jgi:copper chaperone
LSSVQDRIQAQGVFQMLTFEIPNMSCQHCVRAITEAVRGVDAQAGVEARLPEHQVLVDSQAPREQLVQALQAAGYAPS